PRENDDAQSVFAQVLTSLYEQKLATYRGRAALSTWLTLVTRTSTVDHLRRRFGRRAQPRGLRHLDETECDVLRMYYIEGLGLREVLRCLAASDPAWTLPRLLACLQNIENAVDDRSLRRIAYGLHAQSTGASSGRMLAYLDHVREEFKLTEGMHRP